MPNQKGLIHILVVFILLAGIGATFYLSQHTQIFKPKAFQLSQQDDQVTAILRDAQLVRFRGVGTEGESDSNSPAHWDEDTLYVFNSAYNIVQTNADDIFGLYPEGNFQAVTFNNTLDGGRWMEATHKEGNLLYGWYHHEPRVVCLENSLTAPKIGMAVSTDNGATWSDLGFILEAPPDSLECDTLNHYFAGGNGDFTVILDRSGQYFYFLFSNYHRDSSQQGVAVARLAFADKDNPVGKVFKWHNNSWTQPGLGGNVTPVFPVTSDWHGQRVDAFWGPSVHWNTYLNMFVILMNRAKDSDWAQEGIYVSFNENLASPNGWSTPKKIRTTTNWYPQVMGTDKTKQETDKLAGHIARYFEAGQSRWEIVFLRPEESDCTTDSDCSSGQVCQLPVCAPADLEQACSEAVDKVACEKNVEENERTRCMGKCITVRSY